MLCLAAAGELGRKELVEIAPELVTGAIAAEGERAIVEGAIEHAIADRFHAGGTRQEAAGDLGADRTTLWRRAKRVSGGG